MLGLPKPEIGVKKQPINNGLIGEILVMAKESIENQRESNESVHAVESIPLATASVTEQDISSELIVEESTEQALSSKPRHIAKSATLVMLGNLCSSIMVIVP